MCRVDSAKLRRRTREGDQFLSTRVRRRSVFQGGRYPERALTHGRGDDSLHADQLIRTRRAVGISDDHLAYRRRADVSSNVDANALFLEAREISREVGPVLRNPVVLEFGRRLLGNRGIDGRDGLAFARDLRRNSLKDLGRYVRIHEQGEFGLTEHVDEPRRNDAPCSVDTPLRYGLVELADRGDASCANADVGSEPGCACAVDDSAVLDDHVVGRQLPIRSERQRAAACEG